MYTAGNVILQIVHLAVRLGEPRNRYHISMVFLIMVGKMINIRQSSEILNCKTEFVNDHS